MSHEGFQYQKIFQILKYKIESGIMPKGCALPSSAMLCKKYKVSDKTIRRVLALLTEAGLIETRERKRAVVTFDKSVPAPPAQASKEHNPIAVAEILKTAELFCYPLICHGISLCREEDWTIPEQLIQQTDPALPGLFWRNSELFWRFFIARCENELALRVVDSLGFLDFGCQAYPIGMRIGYRNALLEFVRKAKHSHYTTEELHNILSGFFNFTPLAVKDFECFVPETSPLRTGVLVSEQWTNTSEERYLIVCLDILGLISAGVYLPGDQLPSHIVLQKQYGVSVTTTLQAIRMLKQQGMVETTRGKGIFVSANPPAPEDISIPAQLIARYSKRYLETLALLSITARSVALHAASNVSREQAQALLLNVKEMEHVSDLYQPAPIVILEFLTEHLLCKATRAVYMTILENYHIGRKIPKLVNRQNASKKLEVYRRCAGAAQALMDGHHAEFAERTADMFYYTQQQILSEYRRLNYQEALAEHFDGSHLWA